MARLIWTTTATPSAPASLAAASSAISITPATSASKRTTSAASATASSGSTTLAGVTASPTLDQRFLLDHVNHFVGDAEVLNRAAADVALRHAPELVAIPGRADNLSEVDVHPVVAADKVAVVCLAVLELHEHRVILGRP